jgi:phosphatidate cytidylyltransferase
MTIFRDEPPSRAHSFPCVAPDSSTSSRATGASDPAPPPASSRPAIKPGTFVKRLFSWIALWIVALWFIFYGWDNACLILIALFGLAGQWEFYRAQEEKGHKVFEKSGLFCGALIFVTTWYFLVLNPARADYVHFGLELVLVFSLLGGLIRLVIVDEHHKTPIVTAALTVLGLLYVPFLFNFVALLAFMPGHTWENRYLLIYLLAVTKFSDVGAYVVGSLIGRHKMIPRISPGKTWEGFAGAITTSLVISVLMNVLLEHRLPQINLRDSIILGLLLPLVSVVGDLAESVVKRDASIKDSGKTIPGIGGALDLIDSILFTAPVLYFYLEFVKSAAS